MRQIGLRSAKASFCLREEIFYAAASPFLHKPFGKSGEKGKNVVLPFSKNY